ncbi:MAG: hypothetical protein O3A59_09635 [Nitrospirae bacterium]|nr:hypothetical protein [Nitrospirota bacterium]
MNPVSPTEKISRYLMDEDDIRPSDGSLRWRALIPNREGKTSVFRISGLSEQQVWSIAEEKVIPIRNKRLVGRADLLAAVVYNRNLNFSPDVDAASRHADIIEWPDEKEKRRLIAMDLASEAKVIRR